MIGPVSFFLALLVSSYVSLTIPYLVALFPSAFHNIGSIMLVGICAAFLLGHKNTKDDEVRMVYTTMFCLALWQVWFFFGLGNTFVFLQGLVFQTGLVLLMSLLLLFPVSLFELGLRYLKSESLVKH
jgi:hypothetical protein